MYAAEAGNRRRRSFKGLELQANDHRVRAIETRDGQRADSRVPSGDWLALTG